MPDEYKIYVVNFSEGAVVDETFDPFYSREEAIRAANDRVAVDRSDNVTGVGYEVVVPESARVSRVIYWTAHTGNGVVDAGEGEPPWHE